MQTSALLHFSAGWELNLGAGMLGFVSPGCSEARLGGAALGRDAPDPAEFALFFLHVHFPFADGSWEIASWQDWYDSWCYSTMHSHGHPGVPQPDEAAPSLGMWLDQPGPRMLSSAVPTVPFASVKWGCWDPDGQLLGAGDRLPTEQGHCWAVIRDIAGL